MLKKAVVCGAVVVMSTSCAARGSVRPAEPLVPDVGTKDLPPHDSLETFIGKVRTLSTRARPPQSSVQTVEASDPALAAAFLRLAVRPTASSHRAVADEYARLGILDNAHEHLSAAVAIDPRDAAAWDRKARIWRDWGVLHLGLADAYRALYFAPESPIVHNTLGTIFQALGRHQEARARYEKALQVDATAGYALNNLCYSWLLDGQALEAVRACDRALQLQPRLEAARNNLALAYAVSGNLDAAQQVFASAGERGRAEYNLGIVHLARRQYSEAAKAFEAAQKIRPGFRAAEAMARQARNRANWGNEP
jgi:tetratricopeptide (TPR) repeat protein